MIDSTTNHHKILLTNPNYIIVSSANKPINRSANNRANEQHTPSNANSSEPKLFKIRTFTSKVGIGKNARIEGKRIAQEAIASIKEESENWLRPNAVCRRPSFQISKDRSYN